MDTSRMMPQKARKQFSDLAKSLKEEMDGTSEPQLRAMLETSAEVLNSLAKTFSDYEIKAAASETANLSRSTTSPRFARKKADA